jgi:VIT1/CCC1 family predicted Fe2+/Mn2+ transporter
MTFDGTTGTVTAYILTKGTGANDSDWTKLIDAAYNVEANSSMAFAAYAQSASTHAKIKNVKYFKGLVTGVAASSTPETPVTPPAPTGDVFSALPVALLVLSGAAIAVVLKKKEN